MLRRKNSSNKEFTADSLNDSLSDNSDRQIKKKKVNEDYFEDSLQDIEEQLYLNNYNMENASFYSDNNKQDLMRPRRLPSENDSLQSKRNSFGSSNPNTSGILLPNPYPKKGGSRSSSVRHSGRSRQRSNSSVRRDSQDRKEPSFNQSRRNSNLSEEFKDYCRSIQGKDIYHRVDDISQEYEQKVLKDFKKIGDSIPEIKNKVLLVNNTTSSFSTNKREDHLKSKEIDSKQTEKSEEDKAYLASISSADGRYFSNKEKLNKNAETLDKLLEEFVLGRAKKPEPGKPDFKQKSQNLDTNKAYDVIACSSLLRPESARSIPEGNRICVEHETPGFLNPGRASKEFSCIQEEDDVEEKSRFLETNLGKRGRLIWNATGNTVHSGSPFNSNNEALEYSPASNPRTSSNYSGSAKKNTGKQGLNSESVSSLKNYLRRNESDKNLNNEGSYSDKFIRETSEKSYKNVERKENKKQEREIDDDDECAIGECRIRPGKFDEERTKDIDLCNSDSILRKYLGRNFSPEHDSTKKCSDKKVFKDITKINLEMKQRVKSYIANNRQDSPKRKNDNSTMSLSKGDLSSENPTNFLLTSSNGRLSPLLRENFSDNKRELIGSGKENLSASAHLNKSQQSLKEKDGLLEKRSPQSNFASPQQSKLNETYKLKDQIVEEKVGELEKDALLYLKTDNFKIALDKLVKAEQLLDTLTRENPEHKSYVSYLMAEIYSRVGNFEAAEYYSKKGLKTSEIQSINNSTFLVYTFQMYAILAHIYTSKENFILSLDFLNKMITIINHVQGKSELDSNEKLILDQTELVQFNLGEVYQKKGDFFESLQVFEEVFELMETKGSDPRRKLEALQMIAKNCKNLNQNEKLIQTLRIALEMVNNAGVSSEMAAYFFETYASCLENSGEYAEAANYRESALKKKIETTGMNNTQTAFALLNVGKTYYQGNDFENAMRCLTLACSIFEHLYGKQNLYSGNCMVFMAQIFFFQRSYQSSLESYSTALSIYSNILGNEHEHTLRLYLNIIHASGLVGNVERMRTAKARLEDLAVKAQTFEGIVLLNELGNLLRKHGELNESERLYLKSIDLFQNLPDKDKRLRTLSMLISNLAGLYLLKKEFTESINCYRKALLIVKDFISDEQISTAHILLNLAKVYRKVDRYNDAEFYLRQAEKICREKKIIDSQVYRDIREEIISL